MATALPPDADYDAALRRGLAALERNRMLYHAWHGDGDDSYIPDTPFEEWLPGVETLLHDQGFRDALLGRETFFEATQRLQRLRSRHGWGWLIDASET